MPERALPTVLAVDTSTVACSVALSCDGTIYSRHELLPQKHAHRVLEMVDEVVLEAGIDSQVIDLLAYGEGPGAFTGIRIASGVIQGLALGWDKPVLPVSSLLAMAEGYAQEYGKTEDFQWCALLDARMSEVYMLEGHFRAEDAKLVCGEPLLLSPQKVQEQLAECDDCIGVGDIAKEYPELVDCFQSWSDALPNAVSIARLASVQPKLAKSLQQEIPNPLYLRNDIADTIEQRKLKQQAK